MQTSPSHETESLAKSNACGSDVFSVDFASLRNLEQSLHRHNLPRSPADLVLASNTNVLAKFCDVCKRINMDPLHPLALPFVVIFMSKNKHCVESAQTYMKTSGHEEILEILDLHREGVLLACEQLLNSMADWLVLFAYLEFCWRGERGADAQEHARANGERHSIEDNRVVKRMQASLTEAQVTASGPGVRQQLSPLETALMALLYLSPRATPAGKMLERLYTDISENSRDAELRCLRAMSSFKDAMDDEEANRHTLPVVMRCFRVRPDFMRNVAIVLRKQLNDMEQQQAQKNASTRSLLRNYALMAVQKKQTLVSQNSWMQWRHTVSFSVTSSSHLQRLMYFICLQPRGRRPEIFQGLYTSELCARALAMSVEVIDVQVLQKVMDSLRLYTNNVKQLVDFSAKCLQGVSHGERQKLSLVQQLQLYIATFQHESVWKQCWLHVLPVMNHTITSDCAEFRGTHEYDVDGVLENLVRSLIVE